MSTIDPIVRFQEWFAAAKQHPAIVNATAMCLATADAQGQPSARMVLLKAVDDRGFVFYTNMDSRKSAELKHNGQAALNFYWPPLERQVRIEGRVELVSGKEADSYFAKRPRESQIGAWASKQSQPLSGREELRQALEAVDQKFSGKDVPRPDFWSGWRVIPDRIEFWQQGDFRLHERKVFKRVGSGWAVEKLYP